MNAVFLHVLKQFESDYQRCYGLHRYIGLAGLAIIMLIVLVVVLQKPIQRVFDSSGIVIEIQQHTQIQFPVKQQYSRRIQPGLAVKFKDNTGQQVVVPIHHTHYDSARQILYAHVHCTQCQLVLGQTVAVHVVAAKQSILDLFVLTFNPTPLAEDE